MSHVGIGHVKNVFKTSSNGSEILSVLNLSILFHFSKEMSTITGRGANNNDIEQELAEFQSTKNVNPFHAVHLLIFILSDHWISTSNGVQ